jgi:predicted AAA+ superfamily ATPase
MTIRPRIYTAIIRDHLQRYRQMALISGPRQVGKTTACRTAGDVYLNWDNADHRRIILRGPAALAEAAGVDHLRALPPVLVLDELHKHAKWKSLLKGFFDTYGERVRILVTGSSRLDLYRRGGDSLMGRYLLYRMHPWSVGELIRPGLPDGLIQPPAAIDEDEWQALCDHGGFPEPFLRRDVRFSRRWRSLRQEQLSREDLRDVAHVRDVGTMEALMAILGFLIRPWFRNVTKALRKEPKWFLRDWSAIVDPGDRAETMVGCHLLKAVEGWTDLGFGDFELRYLRDKAKREVDFLVVRDRTPWFLVEVKHRDTGLSPALAHFQAQTQAAHAFQAVMDMPFEPVDCFAAGRPRVVPARTLLSQLL